MATIVTKAVKDVVAWATEIYSSHRNERYRNHSQKTSEPAR